MKLYIPMLLLAANGQIVGPVDQGIFENGDPALVSRDAKVAFAIKPDGSTHVWRSTGISPVVFTFSEDFPIDLYQGAFGVYGLSYDGNVMLVLDSSSSDIPLYRYSAGTWSNDHTFTGLAASSAVLSGDGNVAAFFQDFEGVRTVTVYQYAAGSWSEVQTLVVTGDSTDIITNMNDDGTILLAQKNTNTEAPVAGFDTCEIGVYTGAIGSLALTTTITADSGLYIIGGSGAWSMDGIGNLIAVRQDSLDNGEGVPSNQTKIYIYSDNGATLLNSYYVDGDTSITPAITLDGQYIIQSTPGVYNILPSSFTRHPAPWVDPMTIATIANSKYAIGTSTHGTFSVYEYSNATNTGLIGQVYEWPTQAIDDTFADGTHIYSASPNGLRQFVVDTIAGTMSSYTSNSPSPGFSLEASFPIDLTLRNLGTFGISDEGDRVVDLTNGAEGSTGESNLYEFGGSSWSTSTSFYTDVEQVGISGDGTVVIATTATDIKIQKDSGGWSEVQTFTRPQPAAWVEGINSTGTSFLGLYYLGNEVPTPLPGLRVYFYGGAVGSAAMINTFDDVEGHTILDARMSSNGLVSIIAVDGATYATPIPANSQHYLYIYADDGNTQVVKLTLPVDLDIHYDFSFTSFAYDGNSIVISGKTSEASLGNRFIYKFESPWIPGTHQTYKPARPTTFTSSYYLSEIGDTLTYVADTDTYFAGQRNFIHNYPIPNPTASYTHIFYDHAPVLDAYVEETNGGSYYVVIPFDWSANTTATKDGLSVTFGGVASGSPVYPDSPQHLRFTVSNYDAQDAYDAKRFIVDTAKTPSGFWTIQDFEFWYADQQITTDAFFGSGRYYVIDAIRVPSGLVFNVNRTDTP